MIKRVDQPTVMRQRLEAAIAKQDAERGRPLTVREQLANLEAALAKDADTPCPFCGVRDNEVCGYFRTGERCKLEPIAVEMLKDQTS